VDVKRQVTVVEKNNKEGNKPQSVKVWKEDLVLFKRLGLLHTG
jgi:hypothetical protein